MAIHNSKPRRAQVIGILIAAATMASMSSVPAYSKMWQSPGGWEIHDDDDNCAVFRQYEGKGATNLLVILFAAGGSAASLTNTAWSSSKDEEYELSWEVNGNVYRGSAFGLGEKFEERKGFGGKFGDEFVDDIARGSSLDIYRGDIVVDQLRLDGSGSAIAIAKRCLQTVRANITAAEREKQRFEHIPDDPFAGEATKEEAAKQANDPPRPLGSPGAWVTIADYPARAMREEREGVTAYRLTISPAGRVSNCEIISSSGHADLDAETCRAVRLRARFAEISSGSADRHFQQSTTWRLPR